MEREDVRKARGMKAWSVASLATWLLGFENHMGPRWEGGDPPKKPSHLVFCLESFKSKAGIWD